MGQQARLCRKPARYIVTIYWNEAHCSRASYNMVIRRVASKLPRSQFHVRKLTVAHDTVLGQSMLLAGQDLLHAL